MDNVQLAKQIVCRCEEIEDAAISISNRIRETRNELTDKDLFAYNALAKDCIVWLNRLKKALDSYNVEEAEWFLTEAKRALH